MLLVITHPDACRCFVLMLPVLKAHKNTSLLDTFYTRKKNTFNPATYNMVTIA